MLHRLQGNISGGLGKMMVWYDWDELTAWGKDPPASSFNLRTDQDPLLENRDDAVSGSVRARYHPVLGYLK